MPRALVAIASALLLLVAACSSEGSSSPPESTAVAEAISADFDLVEGSIVEAPTAGALYAPLSGATAATAEIQFVIAVWPTVEDANGARARIDQLFPENEGAMHAQCGAILVTLGGSEEYMASEQARTDVATVDGILVDEYGPC